MQFYRLITACIFTLSASLLTSCMEQGQISALIAPAISPSTTTALPQTNSSGIAQAVPTPVVFSGVPSSSLYQLQVTQNGVTKPNFVYVSRAASTLPVGEGQQNKTFNYGIFSGNGPFTVTVTKLHSTATSAVIRPNSLGLGTIHTTVNSSGSTVSFTLSNPTKLSVEFNDDPNLMDAMVILAKPAELTTDVPSTTSATTFIASAASYSTFSIPTGKTTVYFPSGVHQIGNWSVPSTVTHIYLADGAFVRGYFYADRTTGGAIKINGRGVLTDDVYPYHNVDSTNTTIQFLLWIDGYTSGHTIDGITLADSSGFTLGFYGSNSTISHILFHGWRYENDAVHTRGSNNNFTENFYHVNDDDICPSALVNNLTIQNSVFWSLVGGNVLNLSYIAHNLNGVTVQNSDLIHHSWNASPNTNTGSFIEGPDLVAGTDVNPVVQNIVASNINFDVPIPRLLDLRMIRYNGPSTPIPINNLNFTLSNIHLDHQGTVTTPLIYLDGVDSNHTCSGIIFHSLSINGTLVNQSSTLLSTILLLNGVVATPTFN